LVLGDSEIREPLSWVLGIAATVVAVGKVWNLADPGFYLSPYFIGILLGFILHEAAHRGVARRYGLHAEFVAYTPGLLITFLTGLIPGIVILTPGYVKITAPAYTYYSIRDPARALYHATAAGPLTNIVIALVSLLLAALLDGPAGAYLAGIAYINAYIAFFNLLPIPPLDGSKIIRYSLQGWAMLMVASVALLFLS